MLKLLKGIDQAISLTRPLWAWLGQLALVLLGIHLAADQLDDYLYALLTLGELPWPDANAPKLIAAGGALVLELAIVGRAAFAILLTPQQPELSWSSYKRRLSVEAISLPLFWGTAAVAGSWVVGMATQDALYPYDPLVAAILSWAVALLVAWRLGLSGWRRVVGALDDPPKARTRGLIEAPFLLGVAFLVLWDGLPIWGWLP